MRAASMSQQKSPWRNPWVLGWIALVVIVLSVNLAMIYIAARTNPGLVVDDYYERGQNYERTMVQRQAKDQGLLLQVDTPPHAGVNRPATYRFTGVDKAGLPIEADGVTLFAYRPSDAAADFALPMEKEGTGRYRVEVVFPLKGIWDLLISVRQGDDEFNVARRVTVEE